jgi:hypothetical protein
MDFYDENSEIIEEDMDEWDAEEEGGDLEDTSFVCEDCDYRWEELSGEESEASAVVCPMCGSVNVTQL